MRSIATALVACASLTACVSYEAAERSVVSIDGYEMIVGRDLAADDRNKDLWFAMPKSGSGQFSTSNDSNVVLRSIKAIEMTSGCKVIRESIAQPGLSSTTALVDC